MNNGSNNKEWWKSKVIQTMFGQLLFTWSAYFLTDIPVKLCIGNSMLAVAGIIFRSIGVTKSVVMSTKKK